MTAEELVDNDFEISATSTSSDVEITAEVSGHVIDDEEDPMMKRNQLIVFRNQTSRT